MTLQRDLKRARIVLLAAAGRSTRSIAKEVGVQPRIVSLWRHRYADHGLEGLQDKPRPGKQPIYTKTTDKRILKLLDKPPPQGFARWTGPLRPEGAGVGFGAGGHRSPRLGLSYDIYTPRDDLCGYEPLASVPGRRW